MILDTSAIVAASGIGGLLMPFVVGQLFDRVGEWCAAWAVGHATHQECDDLGNLSRSEASPEAEHFQFGTLRRSGPNWLLPVR